MKLFIDPQIADYAARSTAPEPPWLQKLARLTTERMAQPEMLTGHVEGRFLKLIVAMTRPRLIVEIGTFTGYSALSMAEGLPAGGRIVTLDSDPEAAAVARKAIAASPYADCIEIRLGAALDSLARIDEPIDLAFIDADKAAYPEYYEAVLERMPPGGVILLDNMFLSGRVLDPQDSAARALAGLNEKIRDDPRVENVLLTVRDGVQLVRKL